MAGTGKRKRLELIGLYWWESFLICGIWWKHW